MPHVTAAAMATNGVSSSSLTTIGGGGVAGGGGGTAGVVVVVEMIGACVMSGVPATFALVPIVCMSAAVTFLTTVVPTGAVITVWYSISVWCVGVSAVTLPVIVGMALPAALICCLRVAAKEPVLLVVAAIWLF